MSAEIVIVGGGPAGMLSGLLFARAGIDVLVLEKHADFFRDFRGDTVHPSTMQILDELGMLERFLQRPHHRIDRAEIDFNGLLMKVGDFSHLAMPAPFIAMMPQWDFLDFLGDEAQAFPGFALRMEAEVSGFTETAGRISGVSLVGGIGINLAIADAVAAANILAAPMARGEDTDALLARVRKRRWLPTHVVQGAQRAAHERVLRPLIEGRLTLPETPPWPLRLVDRCALLRRIPGYVIGHGVRQEHVRSPLAANPRSDRRPAP